ncbi:MAG: hypothetical protein LPK19_13420, partial [Hymenobacteraceae bacterium]|nr:hypothetical protein [Hymenobacteraceae bacterium]MDX5397227.1 hypothetical protein [Hymenobacteraceae bacterium]MDX5513303.1 hypothetical protein [Hymenobacteraceae bacterium]
MTHPLLPYVLHHFRMIYDVPEQVQVSYGEVGKIQIKQADLSFFDQQNPQPKQVLWAKWQGQQIPFIFDKSVPASLLSFQENSVTIQADII